MDLIEDARKMKASVLLYILTMALMEFEDFEQINQREKS